jgi:hypothetical protein
MHKLVKLLGIIFILLVGMGIGYGIRAPADGLKTVFMTITETPEAGQLITETVEKTITETVTAPSEPMPATPKPEAGWKTINTFTGSDDKSTEDFNVPASYWRVVYSVSAESEQWGLFSFFIYPSGETAMFVASGDLDGSGSETSYVRAEAGDFWIKVNAANLKSWTIEIQIQE